jgi:hypothetical protein
VSIAGIQNPYYLPAKFTPSGNVTLVAGTPTLIATTTVAQLAKNAGGYFPLLLCTIAELQGAAAATALTYSFRFSGGADIDTYTVDPIDLVNSALRTRVFPLIGVESASAWFPTGTIVQLWGSATGQPVTIHSAGTLFLLLLGVGANP